MKRNLWIAALLTLSLLAACGHAETTTPVETAVPTEIENVETEISIPLEIELDYEALYQEKLLQIIGFVRDLNVSDAETDGMTGVEEVARFSESTQEALEMLGYEIRDLNGDGVPELLIATMPVESVEHAYCNIVALYTVRDGAVVQIAEGWSRSRYYLMQDNSLYYSGSSGALYSSFGAYALSADGTALDCLDYYFTYEKTPDNFEDIGVYHNTTGVYDKAQAELTELSLDDFWQLDDDYLSMVQTPNLTALSEMQ